MTVYLCGTITADPTTHRWREEAERLLSHRGIASRSPMRGKNVAKISPDGLKSDVSPYLFVERDFYDIRHSDVLLLYMLGIETLTRQSIGSWAEFGMAIERRMPIIVVATHPMVTEYPFIKKCASAVVGTLEEAVEKIAWMR